MSGHFPVATRKDHQSFCLIEGWVEVRNARGAIGHHVTYELALPDGSVLRTRISHPPNRETYGKSLWAHILRDQLQVTEDVFWSCVQLRVKPARSAPRALKDTVPANLVSQLLAHGVRESEIREMSRKDAIQRMTEIWSRPDS